MCGVGYLAWYGEQPFQILRYNIEIKTYACSIQICYVLKPEPAVVQDCLNVRAKWWKKAHVGQIQIAKVNSCCQGKELLSR